MDGLIGKLEGGVHIAVDMSKHGETCVEWKRGADGKIIVLDLYQVMKGQNDE